MRFARSPRVSLKVLIGKEQEIARFHARIPEELVTWTVLTPDRTYFEDDGDTKFIRRTEGGNIHVVCKPLPEEDKWLVKSVWYRPLNERRRLPRYKSAVSTSEQPKLGLSPIDVWLIMAIFWD